MPKLTEEQIAEKSENAIRTLKFLINNVSSVDGLVYNATHGELNPLRRLVAAAWNAIWMFTTNPIETVSNVYNNLDYQQLVTDLLNPHILSTVLLNAEIKELMQSHEGGVASLINSLKQFIPHHEEIADFEDLSNQSVKLIDAFMIMPQFTQIMTGYQEFIAQDPAPPITTFLFQLLKDPNIYVALDKNKKLLVSIADIVQNIGFEQAGIYQITLADAEAFLTMTKPLTNELAETDPLRILVDKAHLDKRAHVQKVMRYLDREVVPDTIQDLANDVKVKMLKQKQYAHRLFEATFQLLGELGGEASIDEMQIIIDAFTTPNPALKSQKITALLSDPGIYQLLQRHQPLLTSILTEVHSVIVDEPDNLAKILRTNFQSTYNMQRMTPEMAEVILAKCQEFITANPGEEFTLGIKKSFLGKDLLSATDAQKIEIACEVLNMVNTDNAKVIANATKTITAIAKLPNDPLVESIAQQLKGRTASDLTDQEKIAMANIITREIEIDESVEFDYDLPPAVRTFRETAKFTKDSAPVTTFKQLISLNAEFDPVSSAIGKLVAGNQATVKPLIDKYLSYKTLYFDNKFIYTPSGLEQDSIVEQMFCNEYLTDQQAIDLKNTLQGMIPQIDFVTEMLNKHESPKDSIQALLAYTAFPDMAEALAKTAANDPISTLKRNLLAQYRQYGIKHATGTSVEQAMAKQLEKLKLEPTELQQINDNITPLINTPIIKELLKRGRAAEIIRTEKVVASLDRVFSYELITEAEADTLIGGITEPYAEDIKAIMSSLGNPRRPLAAEEKLSFSKKLLSILDESEYKLEEHHDLLETLATRFSAQVNFTANTDIAEQKTLIDRIFKELHYNTCYGSTSGINKLLANYQLGKIPPEKYAQLLTDLFEIRRGRELETERAAPEYSAVLALDKLLKLETDPAEIEAAAKPAFRVLGEGAVSATVADLLRTPAAFTALLSGNQANLGALVETLTSLLLAKMPALQDYNLDAAKLKKLTELLITIAAKCPDQAAELNAILNHDTEMDYEFYFKLGKIIKLATRDSVLAVIGTGYEGLVGEMAGVFVEKQMSKMENPFMQGLSSLLLKHKIDLKAVIVDLIKAGNGQKISEIYDDFAQGKFLNMVAKLLPLLQRQDAIASLAKPELIGEITSLYIKTNPLLAPKLEQLGVDLTVFDLFIPDVVNKLLENPDTSIATLNEIEGSIQALFATMDPNFVGDRNAWLTTAIPKFIGLSGSITLGPILARHASSIAANLSKAADVDNCLKALIAHPNQSELLAYYISIDPEFDIHDPSSLRKLISKQAEIPVFLNRFPTVLEKYISFKDPLSTTAVITPFITLLGKAINDPVKLQNIYDHIYPRASQATAPDMNKFINDILTSIDQTTLFELLENVDTASIIQSNRKEIIETLTAHMTPADNATIKPSDRLIAATSELIFEALNKFTFPTSKLEPIYAAFKLYNQAVVNKNGVQTAQYALAQAVITQLGGDISALGEVELNKLLATHGEEIVEIIHHYSPPLKNIINKENLTAIISDFTQNPQKFTPLFEGFSITKIIAALDKTKYLGTGTRVGVGALTTLAVLLLSPILIVLLPKIFYDLYKFFSKTANKATSLNLATGTAKEAQEKAQTTTQLLMPKKFDDQIVADQNFADLPTLPASWVDATITNCNFRGAVFPEAVQFTGAKLDIYSLKSLLQSNVKSTQLEGVKITSPIKFDDFKLLKDNKLLHTLTEPVTITGELTCTQLMELRKTLGSKMITLDKVSISGRHACTDPAPTTLQQAVLGDVPLTKITFQQCTFTPECGFNNVCLHESVITSLKINLRIPKINITTFCTNCTIDPNTVENMVKLQPPPFLEEVHTYTNTPRTATIEQLSQHSSL